MAAQYDIALAPGPILIVWMRTRQGCKEVPPCRTANIYDHGCIAQRSRIMKRLPQLVSRHLIETVEYQQLLLLLKHLNGRKCCHAREMYTTPSSSLAG